MLDLGFVIPLSRSPNLTQVRVDELGKGLGALAIAEDLHRLIYYITVSYKIEIGTLPSTSSAEVWLSRKDSVVSAR
jgi:hypothetical protein